MLCALPEQITPQDILNMVVGLQNNQDFGFDIGDGVRLLRYQQNLITLDELKVSATWPKIVKYFSTDTLTVKTVVNPVPAVPPPVTVPVPAINPTPAPVPVTPPAVIPVPVIPPQPAPVPVPVPVTIPTATEIDETLQQKPWVKYALIGLAFYAITR